MTATVEDIRDIRGPKAAAESWVLPALGVSVLLIAICAYVLLRRRRARPEPQIQSLKEQTLERLDRTKSLMRSDTAREFGIAASEVIRTYVERRFGVLATQRTTEEFLQSLLQSSNEALARHRALLEQFLRQCDFVKFAGASLEPVDMEALFESARAFVLQTAELPPES
jgi:Domain of unknown function (DUF4381)